MNNLRKFTTEAEYSAATLNYPSVAWITSTDAFHFDKAVPTPATFSGLTVYYNISDISHPTTLFRGGGGSGSGSGSGSGGVLPSSMIIDGTEIEVTNAYQFSTTGEHIVNYSFAENQVPAKFLYNFYKGLVAKAEIGHAITSIGENAFYYCNFTSVTIGNSVTSIGTGAFQNCSALISVNIPNSVTRISDGVFSNCYTLSSCTIGSGVTSIGDEAFTSCNSLAGITSNATTPPTLGNNVFNNTNDCPIYVPAASVSAYINASSWDDYTHRIQAIP